MSNEESESNQTEHIQKEESSDNSSLVEINSSSENDDASLLNKNNSKNANDEKCDSINDVLNKGNENEEEQKIENKISLKNEEERSLSDIQENVNDKVEVQKMDCEAGDVKENELKDDKMNCKNKKAEDEDEKDKEEMDCEASEIKEKEDQREKEKEACEFEKTKEVNKDDECNDDKIKDISIDTENIKEGQSNTEKDDNEMENNSSEIKDNEKGIACHSEESKDKEDSEKMAVEESSLEKESNETGNSESEVRESTKGTSSEESTNETHGDEDSEANKSKKLESKEGETAQMETDDTDTYPEQINFVDVNAPGSPMVIDDDDDDDEIIDICMIKNNNNQRMRNRRRNRDNLNRNGSRKEIVIDLDDDDDDIEIEAIKRKKNRPPGPKGINCCNLECSNPGQELKTAPAFVLTHYGRKYKKGKMEKVCAICFEAAITHQEHLAYVLSEHKPIMTVKFQPRNDTVVLTDSDEEGSEEEDYVPDDVMEDFQEKFKEVMDATIENYDLKYQVEEGQKILTYKLDQLSVDFNEIDDIFNDTQKRLDQLRYELYKDYIPQIQEKPGLIIDDSMFGVREPIIRYSPTKLLPQFRKNQAMQNMANKSLPAPTPIKPKISVSSIASINAMSSDNLKKPPLGVATKKVTQIQRISVPSGSQSELKQEDVVALEQVEVTHKPLPPIGPVTRPKPRLGDVMYVMKLSFYGVWARAKVLEIVPKGTELPSGSLSMYNMYKVKFESSYRKSNPVKQVTGKQMAYTTNSPVRFPVGTRVIAIFQDNDWSKECYYSGVIAEPPKSMNKYRYLVFFDDGYAQYVSHEKILLVCECSRNVWEDIHPDSREFIRKYLEQYPERPMVKLQQGQIVKTEWNGKWWIARVVEVDGSLVKMHFDADGRTEWIYRGSTRLGPLYAELAHAAARKEQGTFSRHRGLGVASLKKRNMPYVEYTRGTDGEEMRRDDSGDGQGQSSESIPIRAVAKKSTTKRPENMDSGQDPWGYQGVVEKSLQPQGRVEYLQLNTSRRPRKFEPHQCGPDCLIDSEYDQKAMKGVNPLVIPMLCAWERQVNRCRGKRVVMYKAPCGRRLRNMEELHRYLRIAKSNMAVDLFDFDFWVHCFAEYVLEGGFTNIKDLSYGAENVPVPCVNCVDRNMPDYVQYSTKREPTDGVDLNLDPEYLTGCDCTDDCQDRDKCACWQLTIQGTAYGPGGAVDPTVGYIYRRLPEPVMTGIYECNSRCKCSNTCLNRVAQQPLQLKLQVFKTENRGWGIRCLNDIPQGGFICIYAGRLLTEQGANEGGKNYGDEYLAELDYIEVVEKLKEGYESDVVEDEEDEEEESDLPIQMKETIEMKKNKAPPIQETQVVSEEEEEEEGEASQDARDSDEDFMVSSWDKGRKAPEPEQSSIRTRLRNRNSRHGSEDSQNEKDKDTDKEKDKDADRESDKTSGDDKESKKGDSHKKGSRSLSSDHYSDDEDSELLRLPSRFAAVSEPPESEKSKKPKNRSVREFFGTDEYCYIMDAKNNGNIGRYLNHSCSPNVFVQNVFVDTHDLRFPWVAFFALTYIHAGTELTWDYNYDVGSVPGKVLHCYCGSNDCRGRLL